MAIPTTHKPSIWQRHAVFEKNSIILVIGILVAISIGGLIEVLPLFYLKSTIEKVEGIRPYSPLELAGRNIYVREGCYNCHSQWCDHSVTKWSVMVTIRSLQRACMIIPFNGVQNARDLILRVSVENIRMIGTAII